MTGLDQVISQIGLDATRRYLPSHMAIHMCGVHGAYISSSSADKPTCPNCSVATQNGNGTTATQVEHYIDLDPAHRLGTNPQQKIMPY